MTRLRRLPPRFWYGLASTLYDSLHPACCDVQLDLTRLCGPGRSQEIAPGDEDATHCLAVAELHLRHFDKALAVLEARFAAQYTRRWPPCSACHRFCHPNALTSFALAGVARHRCQL